jgi:Tsi6
VPLFRNVRSSGVEPEGKEKDKNRLKEINLGLYGVREFEESDPELSRILKELQYIVDEMRKGRKI